MNKAPSATQSLDTRPVRVRFAPSPTGNLHVGGARTALFNWLFAKSNNGTMVLRIEDTDRERSKSEYVTAILDGLSWIGLDWSEGPGIGGDFGPYFQSQREGFYRRFIEYLLSQKKLYQCFCSAETLTEMRNTQTERKEHPRYDGRCRNLLRSEVEARISNGKSFVLRLKTNPEEKISWDDLSKGEVTFSSELLDDFVAVKSDDSPTYNFAVVVDDLEMKISHVIRGEDHISNTPRQILLYNAILDGESPFRKEGMACPLFAHIPMILGSDRSRLSKRHGATSVIEYQSQGFDPGAMRNYLALLGWSPETKQEIMTVEEMTSWFRLEKITSHGAVFDLEKLRWINTEYIKAMSPDEMLEKVMPWLKGVDGFPAGYTGAELKRIVGLYRERIKTYDEISGMADLFFVKPKDYDAKGLEKVRKLPEFADLLNKSITLLDQEPDFSEEQLERLFREFSEKSGVKLGNLLSILRLGISGRTTTPGMFEMISVMGKARCIERLSDFQKFLGAE